MNEKRREDITYRSIQTVKNRMQKILREMNLPKKRVESTVNQK